MPKRLIQSKLCFGSTDKDEQRKRRKEDQEKDISSKARLPHRLWNEEYVSYGFFIPKESQQEKAHCMFCSATYSNSCWVPSKLRGHLENKHPEHKNKSGSFFKQYFESLGAQQGLLQAQIGQSKETNEGYHIASVEMAHVLLTDRCPFTEAETTWKKCYG